MFTVVYEQSTKKVVASGEFSPLPKGCARSSPIEGECPKPLFQIGKNHLISYLYFYDEQNNKLSQSGKDLVVIVSS